MPLPAFLVPIPQAPILGAARLEGDLDPAPGAEGGLRPGPDSPCSGGWLLGSGLLTGSTCPGDEALLRMLPRNGPQDRPSGRLRRARTHLRPSCSAGSSSPAGRHIRAAGGPRGGDHPAPPPPRVPRGGRGAAGGGGRPGPESWGPGQPLQPARAWEAAGAPRPSGHVPQAAQGGAGTFPRPGRHPCCLRRGGHRAEGVTSPRRASGPSASLPPAPIRSSAPDPQSKPVRAPCWASTSTSRRRGPQYFLGLCEA